MNKKLLVAMILSMAMTASQAKAASTITIDGSDWKYGNATTNALYTSDTRENPTSKLPGEEDYFGWVRNDGGYSLDDTVNLSGSGKLTTNNLTQNAYLNATGNSTIIINGGALDIKNTSSIADTVALTINGGSTLNITGGSVNISNNDTIGGTINAQSGTFTFSGGSHDLGNTTIGSAVDFAVTGGSASFNSANNIGKSFANAGTVAFKDGTISKAITGTGTTVINGTVSNTAAVEQAVTVSAGTFNNTSTGSVTGLLTVNNEAVSNNEGVLANVLNNGTFNVLGGSVTSITNSATGTQGVNQSSGTVTNVNNASTYNFTGGSITNFSQSAGDLNISDGASLTITNTTNPLTEAVNAITGGNVTLGYAGEVSTDDTIGTLIINNGASNQAIVTTAGTGDNILSIEGKNTVFTALAGTNIASGSVTVGEKATMNVSDAFITGIDNDGTLNINGVATISTIIGNGNLYIFNDDDNASLTVTGSELTQNTIYNGGDLYLGTAGEDMTLNASIQNHTTGGGWWQQVDGGMTTIVGNVIASDDAEIRQYITITEDGALTIDADNIGYGETKIENNGGLLLSDGTIGNQVTVSGEGITEIINGTVTNNGNINTDSLKIDEGATLSSGASNLSVQNSIENDGDLILSSSGWGASNFNNDVTGDGTTTFNGNVNSYGDVANDVIVNGILGNNGNIDGDVVNNGTFNNNGSITNTNFGEYTTIENNGTFTNNGDISGLLTNNTGAQLSGNGSLTDLVNEEGANASIGASSVTNTILNDGNMTLNGNNSPFADPALYIAETTGTGTTTITGNVQIGNDEYTGATITQNEVNIGSTGGFSFGGTTVTNNNTIIANEINVNGSGWGGTTLANSEGAVIIADTINASAGGFGSAQITNDSAIYADNIILGDNASLSLNESSTTSGDVQLTADPTQISPWMSTQGSVLNMEGDATLDGNILADAGTLNFSATEDNDFILSQSITGVITGSDPESENPNGSYIINTDSPEDSVVIIDKEVLGANEVNASGNLLLDTADKESSSALIGDAQVNIEEGSNTAILTTANEFILDNDVSGEDESSLTLLGNTGETESASDAGTQFTIGDNTIVENTELELTSGELLLADDSMLAENGSTLTIGGSITDPETGDKRSGGTLNTIDGTTNPFETPVTFNNEAQVKVDVNAKSKTADHFDNVTQGADDTAILTDVELQGLSKIVQHTTKLNLSNATGINNLKMGKDLLNKTFTEMTPIRKMTASFNENGMMVITPSSGSNNWQDYNPAVLAAPIAAQFGGYLTQLNSYDQAFMNMDMYMLMPKAQRTALKYRNKVAASQGVVAFDPTNSPNDNPAGWFRPFASFEKTSLHHGPKVENTAYGSYFGGDSSMKDLGHGWDGMWGAYVGYNGSHQSYTDTSIYQNGGTLGLVGMAYKDNFFVGGTINTGASAGEATTKFGREEFTMLMAGAALRTGYNWELANGKFIIQPSLQAAYSFVNTFDYKNAAGVNIESDPLHAITIEPGVKFIGNLKHGWQPYAGVSLVYTIMDRSDVMANDIALPNISINPYVKYGIGVRKTWGERVTGFFQTFFMNGGRSGVGLQAGLRFAIGKDGSNNISGKTPELKQTKITLNNHK